MDNNDDILMTRAGLTMCAAVASLKNGWGARRPCWPEWMYIEELPTGIIIWDIPPKIIATDNDGNYLWDHDYTYYDTCNVEDAIASDWCVYRLEFLEDFALHRDRSEEHGT